MGSLNPDTSDLCNLSLSALASRLATAASTIDTYLASTNCPPLSFSPNSNPDFPCDIKEPSIHAARETILHDARLLHDLVTGTRWHWTLHAHNAIHDATCIQMIEHFELWKYVPLASGRDPAAEQPSASYEDLAASSGLDVHRVRACLQHAMTLRVFAKAAPGRVMHTARSAMFVNDPDGSFRKWVRWHYVDSIKGAGGLVEAMKMFGGKPSGARQTAMNVAYERMNEDAMDIIGGGAVGENFKGAMSWFAAGGPLHDGLLVEWEGLIGEVSRGKRDLKVVDVGGGNGHLSIALAKKFPEINFIVQDKSVLQLPTDNLPESVQVQEHDFFKPQPVIADVYILRFILHDWCVSDAVKILRALIPALRPGAKVLLIEAVLGDDPNEDSLSLLHSGLHMQMVTLLNAHERTLDDWRDLLDAADSRFRLTRVVQPPGSFLSVMEVTWQAQVSSTAADDCRSGVSHDGKQDRNNSDAVCALM